MNLINHLLTNKLNSWKKNHHSEMMPDIYTLILHTDCI